jgi:excinuclease ABC subunit C
MRDEILQKLKTLPTTPGVYLMKDVEGKVFYVGKAKNLRDRVRSYFSGTDSRAFVALLDTLLADLDVVLTNTEKEALIVENDLIKAHLPRFNVRLVDDKRFLCLRLDVRQVYPRLEVVRQFTDDGARYFGPYHSAQSIRETLRLINRSFQLRTCSDHTLTHRQRPCLRHQIKRCPAPCVFNLSAGQYRANVETTMAFLEGREDELVLRLEERMREHAQRLEFEQAAVLRDQVRAITRSLERQRVVSPDFVDRDAVGSYREGSEVEISVLRSRRGRLVDAKRFSFSDMDLPTSEVLAEFAMRYYGEQGEIPEEMLFPTELEWAEPLTEFLSDKVSRRAVVLVPQRGDKRQLVALAAKNARQAFADKQRERGAAQTAVERLQRALHLQRLPERIECFDVSHLQGSEIVASAVRFERGVPRRELYRHYNIKSLANQDDFAAIYEVMNRRARRGLEEGDLPDLIVIDGGKGQLNAARAALEDHGVDAVEMVSLAKSKVLDNAGSLPAAQDPTERSPERVFVLGQKNPVILRQDSSELFLLTRARDEAHRFAITHQRKRRRAAQTRSVLDSIAGLGPKRRRLLLKVFGSVARLKEASVEQIGDVVGAKLAARILRTLGST